MATLEFACTYIDDLLCITKGSLEDHLAKLGLVLTRWLDVGLKVNAGKSFFCAIETEYLGYILTRDGIKPQPKKKKGTCYSCSNTADKCQTTLQVSRHGPILQRPMSET